MNKEDKKEIEIIGLDVSEYVNGDVEIGGGYVKMRMPRKVARILNERLTKILHPPEE